MLPFSVKVVWFTLCSLGTVCSWFILYAFARCTNSYWGPTIYMVGVSVLEGMYCLGMIWHMDPFLMPRSFCWAQITLMNYAAFLISGVCACFSYATTVAVIFPAQADTSPYSTLRFRNYYYVPLGIFPIVATSIFMGVVVKYDAAQPSDGTHCDVTGPLWVRFVGYAGMPLVEAIPCLALALVAGVRIIRMHKAHQRSWLASRQQLYDIDKGHSCTGLPDRSKQLSNVPSKTPTSASLGHGSLSADVHKHRFGLPFPSATKVQPRTSPSHECHPPPSPATSFLTLAHLSSVSGTECVFPEESHPRDGSRKESSESDAVSSVRWQKDESTEQEVVSDNDGEARNGVHSQNQPSPRWYQEICFRALEPLEPPGMPEGMVSAIWRLVLFQGTVFMAQTLLTASTVVDIIRGHESNPTPFGSQHVALVFSAWGPVVVFSHAPAVRARVKGWFKIR